ncbi:trehalose-6-phosphate synthase [Klebsiella pneumoniae]|nr:trehalose-6-phosphate synthase [Klebsiella pneumoniae]
MILVSFQREAWEGYLRVNAMLADKLLPLIEPDDTLWIHDYHLLPFASELRKRGVNNRIGFFLHIPFPTPEIFNALPPHAELLEQLCDYDLLGFQTESDRTAFSTALLCRLAYPTSAINAIRHGVRRSYRGLSDRDRSGRNYAQR